MPHWITTKQPHQQSDGHDDEKEHDAEKDGRRYPRYEVRQAHPETEHARQMRWYREAGDPERGAKAAEDPPRQRVIPPPRDGAQHQKRRADGPRELAALSRGQSSWNSARQSDFSSQVGCLVLSNRKSPKTR